MEIIGFIVMSLLGGIGGLATFIYYLRKGQFDDLEAAKYHMFREDQTSDAEISK